MMSSRRSLSLVFPLFGKTDSSAFPHRVGIHEWQIDYWHLLDEAQAERRVAVTAGTVTVEDHR
jgi:hypothetical protein